MEAHSMHALLCSPESGLQVSSTSQSRSSEQKSSTPEHQRGRSKRLCTPERPVARALGDVVMNRRSSITISPFVGRRTDSGKPMVRSRISSRGKGQSSSSGPTFHHLSYGAHSKGQRGRDTIDSDEGMGNNAEAVPPLRSRSRSPDHPAIFDMAANDTDHPGPSSSAIMDAPSTPTRSLAGRPPTPPSSHRRVDGGCSSSSGTQPVARPIVDEQHRPAMSDPVHSELAEQRRITAELQKENIRLMGAATASYSGLYHEGSKLFAEASDRAAQEKRLLEAFANQAHEAEMSRVPRDV